MTSRGPSPWLRQAVVAAVQWALTLGFVLDAIGDLLAGYPALSGATGGGFVAVPEQWFYAPLAGALVGGVAGYRWITERLGARSAVAHRRRVRFVAAFVAAGLIGSLGLLATAVWLAPFGTARWIAVGAAFDLAPLIVAGVVGYRFEWLPSPSTPAGL